MTARVNSEGKIIKNSTPNWSTSYTNLDSKPIPTEQVGIPGISLTKKCTFLKYQDFKDKVQFISVTLSSIHA